MRGLSRGRLRSTQVDRGRDSVWAMSRRPEACRSSESRQNEALLVLYPVVFIAAPSSRKTPRSLTALPFTGVYNGAILAFVMRGLGFLASGSFHPRPRLTSFRKGLGALRLHGLFTLGQPNLFWLLARRSVRWGVSFSSETAGQHTSCAPAPFSRCLGVMPLFTHRGRARGTTFPIAVPRLSASSGRAGGVSLGLG